MEGEPTQDLNVVEALAESAATGLAHERETVDHAIIVAPLPQRHRAVAQLLVAERSELRFAAADVGDEPLILRVHSLAY
jgi:hypothetical protein